MEGLTMEPLSNLYCYELLADYCGDMTDRQVESLVDSDPEIDPECVITPFESFEPVESVEPDEP